MYKPFTIQITYIHLVLNSAPQSIIVWNSTLVNRQTKSSRYGNLGFLGYISHSSFMLIIVFPTGEMSMTLILASCICNSWSLIRAPILSIEKFQGRLALISVAMQCNAPARFFLFLFSALLIFVFIFSWFQNLLYQIPKSGVIFCHCSHWSIVLFCSPSGTSSSSTQRGRRGEERGSRCRSSIHKGTDPQQGRDRALK